MKYYIYLYNNLQLADFRSQFIFSSSNVSSLYVSVTTQFLLNSSIWWTQRQKFKLKQYQLTYQQQSRYILHVDHWKLTRTLNNFLNCGNHQAVTINVSTTIYIQRYQIYGCVSDNQLLIIIQFLQKIRTSQWKSSDAPGISCSNRQTFYKREFPRRYY